MYCILVTGIPAAGKSTLAGRLADALALPLLQKDAIKEILFDDLGFRSREEKVKLGVASMDIMYHMAGRLMALGQPFILENNFEDVSRPGLLALLERYGYTALTVSLTGDYRRIYERFLRRNADPSRHRGHVVNGCYPETGVPEQVSAPSYEQFVEGITRRGMDRFTANGPRIVVDTTSFAGLDFDALAETVRACTSRL